MATATDLSPLPSLPKEVLDIICRQLDTARDILNLSSTCKTLRTATIANDTLWKSRFNQDFKDIQVPITEAVTITHNVRIDASLLPDPEFTR